MLSRILSPRLVGYQIESLLIMREKDENGNLVLWMPSLVRPGFSPQGNGVIRGRARCFGNVEPGQDQRASEHKTVALRTVPRGSRGHNFHPCYNLNVRGFGERDIFLRMSFIESVPRLLIRGHQRPVAARVTRRIPV